VEYAAYSSPTYLVDNISLNLLGMSQPLSHLGSDWVLGISAMPAQINNSMTLLGQLIPTIPGGIEWFLDIFVRGPWPGY
jgi:hypothetical protein